MSDFKPGQIAKATVHGVPNVTVMRHESGGWFSAEYVAHWRTHSGSDVTDVRPLVVLDLAAANDLITADEVAEHAIKTLRRSPYISDGALADQIDRQTQPPRPAIEEPKGLGAVVEDTTGGLWARGPKGWTFLHADGQYLNWKSWDDRDDPLAGKVVKVHSEGVK